MPDLTRFLDAQQTTYHAALAELGAGRKASHWMWFIFPQLRSLGQSANSQYFGITDLAEADAYLADPVLGPRLQACSAAVLAHADKSAEQIMGTIDAMKLRSSMTLFDAVGRVNLFSRVLDAFYDGVPCPLTLAALGRGS